MRPSVFFPHPVLKYAFVVGLLWAGANLYAFFVHGGLPVRLRYTYGAVALYTLPVLVSVVLIPWTRRRQRAYDAVVEQERARREARAAEQQRALAEMTSAHQAFRAEIAPPTPTTAVPRHRDVAPEGMAERMAARQAVLEARIAQRERRNSS